MFKSSILLDKVINRMATFVFRNHTVEAFLGYDGMTYSGYDDISVVPGDVDRYIWFYQVPVNADSLQLADEISSFKDKLDLVLASTDGIKPFVVFSLVNLFMILTAMLPNWLGNVPMSNVWTSANSHPAMRPRRWLTGNTI